MTESSKAISSIIVALNLMVALAKGKLLVRRRDGEEFFAPDRPDWPNPVSLRRKPGPIEKVERIKFVSDQANGWRLKRTIEFHRRNRVAVVHLEGFKPDDEVNNPDMAFWRPTKISYTDRGSARELEIMELRHATA